MKNYSHINDLNNLQETVQDAISLKENPLEFQSLGEGKTICLLFFNNSLRTRLSTQKAAQNLGLNAIVMNFGSEGWQLEYGDGTIMNKNKSEHVKEAAKVVSQYCDIVAIRAFAGLKDKEQDEAELVINSFIKYASVPVVNMESSVGHPLQALADAITLEENKVDHKPKVVLSWAPHPKALPHAVANSFIDMMHLQDADFVITHPKGYELNTDVVKNASVEYDQEKAFKNADYIYVKNWSSYKEYGQVIPQEKDWIINGEKMNLTNNAKFMHCLPVRRNVVVADEVIDSTAPLVLQQANNRTFAAQTVLLNLLKNEANA